MRVYVDNRETSKRKHRAQHIFEETIVKQLDYGDYVYKNTAVEFKTCDDFISSVKTGRVYRQAVGLSENYESAFIIIYGDINKSIRKTRYYGHYFSIKQYLGALSSLSQLVHVLKVDNESQAWDLLVKLFEKSNDNKNRRIIKPKTSVADKIVLIISIIGGISVERAKKVQECLEIKNFKDLTSKSYEDFCKVKCIGDKTSEKIVKWLKG